MLDIQAPPNLGNVVQQLAQQFTTLMTIVITTVDATIVEVARLACVTILMLGILLYFTHAERRLGWTWSREVLSSLSLSEFVFPVVSRL